MLAMRIHGHTLPVGMAMSLAAQLGRVTFKVLYDRCASIL